MTTTNNTPEPEPVNPAVFMAEYYTDILDCGHHRTEPTSYHSTGIPTTPGYATMQDGSRVCYECADNLQMAALEDLNVTEFTGYLSSDGRWITSWTGGKLATVVRLETARAGFWNSEISYVRAHTMDGRRWYGKNGGPGMAITMRVSKASD